MFKRTLIAPLSFRSSYELITTSLLYHSLLPLYEHSPDRKKATIQVLQAHSDIWHVGKDTIDLRLNKRVFARVQKFFPECRVIVANVESFVQQAEMQMFPVRMADEQAWVEEVMAETMPKVCL